MSKTVHYRNWTGLKKNKNKNALFDRDINLYLLHFWNIYIYMCSVFTFSGIRHCI